ncbi:MAG: AraC family transcriptional regulator [Pedobacter sp.]|nr:AraC family transcriptional regulator [Pedobacter sp.]
MVCDRCKIMVRAEFEKLGLTPLSVVLGEVEIGDTQLDVAQLESLTSSLYKLGFELLTDRKQQLVNQIKSLLIGHIHDQEERLNTNLSSFLSHQLGLSYASLSTLFSEMENGTIEQFVIRQKIEKAKELLTYNENSISEIAYRLDYSSIAHFSSQFKKITGQTPSFFKKSLVLKRQTLDRV